MNFLCQDPISQMKASVPPSKVSSQNKKVSSPTENERGLGQVKPAQAARMEEVQSHDHWAPGLV